MQYTEIMDPGSILPKLSITAAIIIFSFAALSLMGFLTVIRPGKITSRVTPRDYGLTFDRITFTTEDNIELVGWFIPNEHTDKTVILLHGYPADKGNILPSLAFLAEHYNLLLFDFRYLGESGGVYSTAGANETKDLAAAIRWLKERGINEIGIWGFSLGGAVALMTAGSFPEVKAVVSESSYARLSLLAPSLYPFPGLQYPLASLTSLWAHMFLGIDIRNISPATSARELGLPILIIHSKNDRVIPFKHALLLQDALKNNARAEFWFKDDLMHGELSGEYNRRVTQFFQQYL